ncbi:MAG: transketolase [Actinobacteria bacterium]|nr:transketolase [Actinomycetota bacterium]
MQKENIKKLEKIANNLRITVVDMLYKIGLEARGHPGPALSIADIIACLYFKILKIDAKNPKWPDRDRFILSKGHACPTLYAALALKGYFSKNNLYTLRHVGSILQGHPDMKRTPGIDMTSGSLGNGLGAGIGMAIAAKIDARDYRTYVLVGDGEIQEGIVWESIMYAGHLKLDNLVLIIDRNRWQSCSSVECTLDIEPLSEKLKTFKWDTTAINGHNVSEIIQALTLPNKAKPLAIIANTIKGKGVSFMEEDNSWHQRAITSKEYQIATSELIRGDS